MSWGSLCQNSHVSQNWLSHVDFEWSTSKWQESTFDLNLMSFNHYHSIDLSKTRRFLTLRASGIKFWLRLSRFIVIEKTFVTGRYHAKMKRNDLQSQPNRLTTTPFCRSHQDASIGSLESFWNEIPTEIILIHCYWEDFCHRPVPWKNEEIWFKSQSRRLTWIPFSS